MLTIYTANFSFRLLPMPRPATTTNSAAIIINSPRYLFFFCRTSFAATAIPSSNTAALTFPSSFGNFSPANNSATVTSSAPASASQTAMSGNRFVRQIQDLCKFKLCHLFFFSKCPDKSSKRHIINHSSSLLSVSILLHLPHFFTLLQVE